MDLSAVFTSLILLILTAATASAKVAKLPPNLKRCSWKSPSSELNECLRIAVEDGHKELRNGDATINVVKLEPLTIPEIKIGGAAAGPVSINIIQRNVQIYGLSSEVQVQKYFVDYKKNIMGGQFLYPNITLIADQTTDGRILLVPIKGTGKATIIIKNYLSNFTTGFQTVVKNGYHYLVFDTRKFEYNMDVDKITFTAENLFNGDKALGDATNQVINDNWKLLFTEMKPIYELTFKKLLTEALNKFFSKVPMEEVMLDYDVKD